MHRPPLTNLQSNERFVFIDALRGIAALSVLYHHLLHNSVLEVTLRRILPLWAAVLSDWGACGVRIFFVLSGFVIAHSLRASRLDGQAVMNFIIRRQIRLDPPYWCVMGLVLGVQLVRLQFPALNTPPLPESGTVVLNALYLQRLAGAPSIVDVAWTLCLEIQFYLFFILLLALAASWPRQRTVVAAGLVLATGVGSVVALFLGLWPASLFPYWYLFAAGALCYWAMRGTVSKAFFFTLAGVMGTAFVLAASFLPVALAGSGPLMIFAGLATVLAIYVVGRAGRLGTLWNHPVLQYFGRISYSLYLVHLTVVSVVLSGAYKLVGDHAPLALGWMVIAGLLSIAAGHGLFLLVERPCMRFASTIRRHPELAAPVPGEPPVALPALHGSLSASTGS